MIVTDIGSHFDRIVDVAVVVLPMFWWFVRWVRRIEGSYQVAKDVTVNHLPFIYGRLKTYDTLHDIANPDHPNIILIANGSK